MNRDVFGVKFGSADVTFFIIEGHNNLLLFINQYQHRVEHGRNIPTMIRRLSQTYLRASGRKKYNLNEIYFCRLLFYIGSMLRETPALVPH